MQRPPSSSERSLSTAAMSVRRVLEEEVASAQPKLRLTQFVARLIPRDTFSRVRTQVLRSSGWKIGKGSLLFGVPDVTGTGAVLSRLSIGTQTFVNVGCFFELNDRIVIGDNVNIGHEVMLLTSTHQLGRRQRRAGNLVTAPIEIGAGSWIGARAVVLPGVTIGEGAVVSAGAVVNKDVPANTVVAGTPAEVVVRRLPG